VRAIFSSLKKLVYFAIQGILPLAFSVRHFAFDYCLICSPPLFLPFYAFTVTSFPLVSFIGGFLENFNAGKSIRVHEYLKKVVYELNPIKSYAYCFLPSNT